ncbi:hypothetical protein [Aurantiacibacter aquimixticola]|uniref:Lipoprotein n=1 Tax=Aurantiacibacter aquimixticola TaxID=1958945 RepID=A0A419RRM5_9SPHN|nr:hypothetical protein [Aurantiacibacter aquimixticola]RJY08440.1 hypothetical protein D6201_02865 [Aurantiacibacter aquimixticola]
MVRCIFLLAACGLLTSCGEELSEAERLEENAAVAERVRQANEAGTPLVEITPETISDADREINDLLGDACSYAPGTSRAVRAIARESDAYVKIDGQMVRFAADPGSRELPANSRTLYNGREYVLRFAIEDAAAADTVKEGTMWLYDRFQRTVYTGTGPVMCES